MLNIMKCPICELVPDFYEIDNANNPEAWGMQSHSLFVLVCKCQDDDTYGTVHTLIEKTPIAHIYAPDKNVPYKAFPLSIILERLIIEWELRCARYSGFSQSSIQELRSKNQQRWEEQPKLEWIDKRNVGELWRAVKEDEAREKHEKMDG